MKYIKLLSLFVIIMFSVAGMVGFCFNCAMTLFEVSQLGIDVATFFVTIGSFPLAFVVAWRSAHHMWPRIAAKSAELDRKNRALRKLKAAEARHLRNDRFVREAAEAEVERMAALG